MQAKYRTFLCAVTLGISSLVATRMSAQVEGADNDHRGTSVQPQEGSTRKAESSTGEGHQPVTIILRNSTLKDVLRAVARQAGVQLIYNDCDIQADRLVSVAISDTTVEEALAIVLRGTDLRARPTEDGVVIERQADRERSDTRGPQGSVRGRVTDAATHRPIPAVAVRLEDASLTATTDGDGLYRFAKVPAGEYVLTARRVGYEKMSKAVVVEDGEDITANLAMTASPTILDQVVTTGTVIPTEVKALPTPVSVITSDQIAQQHAFTMMAIVRQAVPTAVAHDSPNVPANTTISVRGASSLTGPGYMKIFVDGVESSSFGNTPVDPSSIDRIEIIRGPQAATLYGADAAGGVIQIFTKRGDTSLARPQVSARAALGVTQTPYPDFEAVARQRYSGSVRGGAPHVSYRIGGGYTSLADYVPENGPARQHSSSVYGGMRFSRGMLVVDLSGRYYRNTLPELLNPELYSTGYIPLSRSLYTRDDWANQTYGARTTVSPASWLTNQLTLGVDRFELRNTQTQPRLTTPGDTLLSLHKLSSRKLSAGYDVTASGRMSELLAGSLTLGIDHYVQVVSQLNASQALNTSGTIETVPPGGLSFSDNSVINSGYFAQAQVSFRNALFLTLGVRAEDNSTFGKDYGLATLPRVGASYVQPIGGVTLKLRASYGKSLRTPGPTKAAGLVTASAIQIANPELAPERQQGWDGGVDLIFGSKGSLGVSAFDQTAVDLIAFLQVASQPLPTYQYRNIGEVSNKGLEVEAAFTFASWLALRAQYGYVRSRVMSVGAAGGQVVVGDVPVGVPAHTAGAVLMFTPRERTTMNAGLTYSGSFRNTDVLGELRCLATVAAPACPDSFLSTFSFRDFIKAYPGFAKFNMSIMHRFNRHIEMFLSIDNLTNKEVFEFDNSSTVAGRTTMLGFQITY